MVSGPSATEPVYAELSRLAAISIARHPGESHGGTGLSLEESADAFGISSQQLRDVLDELEHQGAIETWDAGRLTYFRVLQLQGCPG